MCDLRVAQTDSSLIGFNKQIKIQRSIPHANPNLTHVTDRGEKREREGEKKEGISMLYSWILLVYRAQSIKLL